jgi:hypothetical protein
MKLTSVEISSGLWRRLTDHYTPLLAKTRARAENPALSEAERLALLYRIAFIKEFLEMAEPEERTSE